MSIEDSSEFKDLLRHLSDDDLQPSQESRLNEILKISAEARQSYLDYMMFEALLQREIVREQSPSQNAVGTQLRSPMHERELKTSKILKFPNIGDTRSWNDSQETAFNIPPNQTRRPDRSTLLIWMVAASILLMAGITSMSLLSNGNRNQSTNAVALRTLPLDLPNAGFELEHDAENIPGGWLGDVAEHVEIFNGVAPVEGRRMLRFVKSTSDKENVCEVYQMVDLQQLQTLGEHRSATVEASASFNSNSEALNSNSILDGDYSFGISVYAFSELPAGAPEDGLVPWQQSLSSSDIRILADKDEQSWQQLEAQLPLPPGTRFLVVKLSTTHTHANSAEEFPGQFVDDVTLNLVSSL